MATPASSVGQLQRAGNSLAPQQKRLITSKHKTREGGPGSGPRKTEAVLKSHGFKRNKNSLQNNWQKSDNQGRTHSVDVKPDGSWSRTSYHTSSPTGTKAGSGTDAKSLHSHLSGVKESVRHIRESFSPSVSFMEQGQDDMSTSPNGKKQKNRVYLVTIIEEGMGNSKDKNWYSGEALVNGAKLFNGSKAYADHPDAIAEKTLPERSMKDLVGWYSNCAADKNPTTGKARLRGKLHFFPAAKWLTDMIDTILTDPSAQGLFGISINAIGKTRPGTIQGEQVNYVESFQRVDSADVVTEPAARGKFEKILESRSGVRGRSGARVNSNGSNKRMREAGQLSPKVVKKLADECTAAAMSDDPDEMKQALLDVQKELYPLSSISGKGPGQSNEEQYSNVNPAGGSEMAGRNDQNQKVRASAGGRRLVRRKKRFTHEADGTGADNENLGEPSPDDIESNLEEADVEDQEDNDLGEIDDFGDSSKQKQNREAQMGGNGNQRRRVARRPVQTQEDEGIEGAESLEDEGMEDGNSTSMMPQGGGGQGQGGSSMPAPSAAGPGSSRMVTAKSKGQSQDDAGGGGMDGDGDGGDGQDQDSLGDGDDMGMDDDLGESLEDESMEGMEGMEDESMEAEPAMQMQQREARGNRRGRRRQGTREAGEKDYGTSGRDSLPSPAGGSEDYAEDFTQGKRDTSTSGTGKSYKIKTSIGTRNKPVHPKMVRKLVHEANRRIEILVDRVRRLRESVNHKEDVITRYQGIISFHNSKVTARRLLESAVRRDWLPEGYANTLAPKLYGRNKTAQIREIKIHARLLEATREAVDDGRSTHLLESVEGMGARGGAVSRTGTTAGVESELIEAMAGDGIPMVEE